MIVLKLGKMFFNMNNSFFFISLLITTSSCETENIFFNQETDKTEKYSFTKIEYYVTDEPEKEIFYENLPQIDYYNNTTTVQNFIYDPLIGFMITSQFESDDINAFSLLNDSTFVSIPINIDPSQHISLGNSKWLYSRMLEKQKSDIELIKTIVIEPETKVKVNTKLFFQKFVTGYSLTLHEISTNTERKISGIWIGIYPIDAIIEVSPVQ